MIVRTLHMQNFMPYYGDTEIVFPEDSITNTTIFFGENTKGKTSILNAFRWVLYGEAESKGRSLSYQELLNKKAADEGETQVFVELTFISDRDEYVVRRTMTSPTQKTDGNLIFQINGQPVTVEAGIKAIERIAPHGTRRFFLFDGELLREYEELMEPTTNTAKKIKKAIEDVMGFPSLVKALDLLDVVERRYRAESKQEKSSNEAVDILKEERDQLVEKIIEKESELDRIEAKLL